MAYIRSKKVKGKIYYYVVEGKIINGKVKQKVLKYLGSIDKIIKMAELFENAKSL